MRVTNHSSSQSQSSNCTTAANQHSLLAHSQNLLMARAGLGMLPWLLHSATNHSGVANPHTTNQHSEQQHPPLPTPTTPLDLSRVLAARGINSHNTLVNTNNNTATVTHSNPLHGITVASEHTSDTSSEKSYNE